MIISPFISFVSLKMYYFKELEFAFCLILPGGGGVDGFK